MAENCIFLPRIAWPRDLRMAVTTPRSWEQGAAAAAAGGGSVSVGTVRKDVNAVEFSSPRSSQRPCPWETGTGYGGAIGRRCCCGVSCRKHSCCEPFPHFDSQSGLPERIRIPRERPSRTISLIFSAKYTSPWNKYIKKVISALALHYSLVVVSCSHQIPKGLTLSSHPKLR